MSRRKPRGDNAGLKVTAGAPPEIIRGELPDEKDAIERRILELTLKASEFMKIDLYDLTAPPVQNGENDFDFTLTTKGGTEYLDLVEIVLEGGYDDSPSRIAVGAMADQMFEQVKKKAKKYGSSRRSVVHLLLYSTHWKFLPSDSAIALLSLYCFRRQHGFKTVAVMMPIMDEAAMLWKCYPAPGPLVAEAGHREQQLRCTLTQLGAHAAVANPDGSVGWDLPG